MSFPYHLTRNYCEHHSLRITFGHFEGFCTHSFSKKMWIFHGISHFGVTFEGFCTHKIPGKKYFSLNYASATTLCQRVLNWVLVNFLTTQIFVFITTSCSLSLLVLKMEHLCSHHSTCNKGLCLVKCASFMKGKPTPKKPPNQMKAPLAQKDSEPLCTNCPLPPLK